MTPFFRLIAFFALVTSVFAAGTLDALIDAAQGFSLAILQQIAAVQSITTPKELAENTISYAAAKTAYYDALRTAMPELTDIAPGKHRDRPKWIGSPNRFQSPGGSRKRWSMKQQRYC